MSNELIEKISPEAIVPMMTIARHKTWEAIDKIASLLLPGMTEKEAIKIANQYLALQGVKKFWHQTHIRFGSNTIYSFNDPYLENSILKNNDIFFIDIGPIWENIEGDCGKTFLVGNVSEEQKKITHDVKNIFDKVQDYWRLHKVTGKELCEFAHKIVLEAGYLLNPAYVKGHRLSEFSHKLYTNEKLFDLDFNPAAERWVLEIHICTKDLKFGAFFEDILH
ncbi:M24 family metallopeptidase [Pigmentibacter sp. JX0631]|uniref:M24 family metallopeptidase n=1 Tax=Pigmentibacter sp. JX0631 TaxID=2976982 RepID=UPI0024690A80|nr:M24 family metallopeptidase [Pigmentibacter sp. JX0631]WGL60368.1 M24 family metallopeptidase [Pigmentibacter sp. JX0631]